MLLLLLQPSGQETLGRRCRVVLQASRRRSRSVGQIWLLELIHTSLLDQAVDGGGDRLVRQPGPLGAIEQGDKLGRHEIRQIHLLSVQRRRSPTRRHAVGLHKAARPAVYVLTLVHASLTVLSKRIQSIPISILFGLPIPLFLFLRLFRAITPKRRVAEGRRRRESL